MSKQNVFKDSRIVMDTEFYQKEELFSAVYPNGLFHIEDVS